MNNVNENEYAEDDMTCLDYLLGVVEDVEGLYTTAKQRKAAEETINLIKKRNHELLLAKEKIKNLQAELQKSRV